MGLNQTPAGERIHIGFFGMRNAGKSSVMNAVIGQDLAVVSDIKGTTTDPVYKSMELLPLGPVLMMDTAGIDDEGELGNLRIKKSLQILNKTDAAVLVIDGNLGIGKEDKKLLERIQKKQIPYVVAVNKADLWENLDGKEAFAENLKRELTDSAHLLFISAKTGKGIEELKEKLAYLAKENSIKKPLVSDLISPSDLVILVVPIDKAAPKGRLILPQQQTIRDILDSDAMALTVKDNQLQQTLKEIGKKPKLVITDSQVFKKVANITPKDILLTSFSILFARYKGNLESAVLGVKALEQIQDGDRILISEGCTHHRQCGDIGTVKLPNWIREYTGKEPCIEFTSGQEFPEDLRKYRLIVHCGGCMLGEREMKYRIGCAQDQNVPMTNYGILIAYTQGILKRSVEPFPQISRILEESRMSEE